MLKDVQGVRRFQVVQERLETFTLSIVGDAAFGLEREAEIRRELGKLLGNSVTLEIRRVDEIPLTASGKQRVTVSRLP
jgi:phenylacetate-CoA ligase